MKRERLIHQRYQKGGIIPFLVFTVPVLITFIVFLLDLSMTQASLEQAGRCANLLAITGVEQMAEAVGTGGTPSSRFVSRMNQVKERIKEFSSQCKFLAQHELTDPTKVVFAWESSVDADVIVAPANYYFDAPTTSPPSSCTSYPCTVVFTDNPGTIPDTSTDAQFNAWAVRIKAGDDGFSLARLGRAFFGENEVEVHQQSVATALPRNVMFLVDVSNSAVSDTHPLRFTWEQAFPDPLGMGAPPGGPKDGRGGYFSFILTNAGSIPPLNAGEICPNINPAAIPPVPEWQALPDRGDNCQWRFLDEFDGTAYTGGMIRVGASAALQANPKVHFKDDYAQANPVTVNPNYASYPYASHHFPPSTRYRSVTGKFRVDTFSAPLGAMPPPADNTRYPQPLTNIFTGLKAASTLMKDRENSGDMVGYVFFEKWLHWNRVVKLTNNYDYLLKLSDFRNELHGNNRNDIMALGLFPGAERLTNLTLATAEAFDQLMEGSLRQRGLPTSDAIVYIGDFLPNCRITSPDPIPADWGVTSGSTAGDWVAEVAQFNETAVNAEDRACFDNYGHFDEAVTQLNQFAMQNLVPNGITFNFIAVGGDVSPHTLDIQDPADPTRCLTEAEARAQGLEYVRGGRPDGRMYNTDGEWQAAYNARSNYNPFYQAIAEGYRLTRATGGIYAPILQVDMVTCDPDGDGAPNEIATPDMTVCEPTSALYRRTQDRQCRNSQKQITDYMEKIVRDNPFRIVCSGRDCVNDPGHGF